METTKPKKELKKNNKLNEKTYNEINEINKIIGRVKNTGLSVDSLRNLLKLKASMKEHMKEFDKVSIAVMEKYGVEAEKEGVYRYEKHAEIDKIKADLKEAESIVVKIEPTKFMTVKELQLCLPDESIDVVEYLSSLLVKEKE